MLAALKRLRIDPGHAAFAVVLVICLGWSLATATCRAEDQAIDKKELPKKKSDIQAILRAGSIAPADAALFDKFFNEFLLEQFVKPWPNMRGPFAYSLDDLPKLRRDIKNLLLLAKSGPAHDRVNALVYDVLAKVLRSSYPDHEAAIKYNALLLLGDLNEDDQPGKPKPWSKPFPVLLKVVQSPKFKDYMKTAALVGIERYAVLGAIPADNVADVTKVLVDLVNQQDPPAGRDPAAHQYLRRCAGEILAFIGRPGPGNCVVKALENVAVDPKARPTLRCEMAQFLGQLKYPPAAKVDLQQLANGLGHQTIEVCKQELDAAKAANRAPRRRMIVYSLASTMVAVGGNDGKGGLKSSASGTTAEFIGSLYAKVKLLHSECESSDSADGLLDTEAVEISAKLDDLERVLAPKTAAKPEPLMAAERKDPIAAPAKQ